MRIERHSAIVEEDLPEIYDRIASDDPAAAECVLNAIEETFEQVAMQPNIGVVYITRNRKMIGVRMLPVTGFNNYLIFYWVEVDSINVLYVVHGARHLPRMFGREMRQ